MADMTDDILDGVNRKDMKAWEKLYAIYYAAVQIAAEEKYLQVRSQVEISAHS